MEGLELTLPTEHPVGKVTLEHNKETGNSRLVVHNNKAKLQYVGKIESQEQLDMILDTLLYVVKL